MPRKRIVRKLTQAKIDKLFQTGRISKEEKKYLEHIIRNIPTAKSGVQGRITTKSGTEGQRATYGVLKPGRPKPPKRKNKKNNMKG